MLLKFPLSQLRSRFVIFYLVAEITRCSILRAFLPYLLQTSMKRENKFQFTGRSEAASSN